jgi:hypothetical protein
MLRRAYNSGVAAACQRFKVAIDIRPGTLGADRPVAPPGEEQSHGTELLPYPKADSGGQLPSETPGKNYGVDFLWDTSNYDNWAPGATGEWGSETIG